MKKRECSHKWRLVSETNEPYAYESILFFSHTYYADKQVFECKKCGDIVRKWINVPYMGPR